MQRSFSFARRAFGAAIVLLLMAACAQGSTPGTCPAASLSPIPTASPILIKYVYILGCEGGEGCFPWFKPNDINVRLSDQIVAVNQSRTAVEVSDLHGCPVTTIVKGASAPLPMPRSGTTHYVVRPAGSRMPANPTGQTVLNVHALQT
jgi:hypothetical protein